MPGSRPIRVAIVVAALAATVAGYRWWTSPERLIHRILGEVASALSHDEPEADLRALSAVAALQAHLAPTVFIDTGTRSGPVSGRQDVIALAARLRASTPMMRVQFFDAVIALSSDSAADTRVTVQVTTRDAAGEETAAAYLVVIDFVRPEGRWLVARARVLPPEEASL